MQEHLRTVVSYIQRSLTHAVPDLQSCCQVLSGGLEGCSSSADAIFLKDWGGRLRYHNAAFARHFGGGSDRRGQFGSVFLPENMRRLSADSDRLVREARCSNYVAYRVPGDSADRIFETLKVPLCSSEICVGILGISREVPADELCHFPELQVAAITQAECNPQMSISVSDKVAAELEQNDRLLAKLSPRQAQVLELLVQGLSNRQIAGALELSDRTIEKHKQALFRNLGVRNGIEASRVLLLSSGYLEE